MYTPLPTQAKERRLESDFVGTFVTLADRLIAHAFEEAAKNESRTTTDLVYIAKHCGHFVMEYASELLGKNCSS